jgi:hypothetical protein
MEAGTRPRSNECHETHHSLTGGGSVRVANLHLAGWSRAHRLSVDMGAISTDKRL